MNEKTYFTIEKANLRRINIHELPKQMPNFENSFESKDILIQKWLTNWIVNAFKTKQIRTNELLPQKETIASHLGVSIGTVQNAIRYVEDNGYLESKQRIGTMIKDFTNPIKDVRVRKLTSKREKVITAVKKFIVEKKYKVGMPLPSSRQIGIMLNSSSNTTRLALEYLCSIDVLESRSKKGNEANWIVKQIPVLTEAEKKPVNFSCADTLVNQVIKDLKKYINENYKPGDKLCAHGELADIFKVSIKTIHDGLKQLIAEEILQARRGRYGTTILKMPNQSALEPKKENSIFAKAQEAAFYNYQKIENHISEMIRKNFELGDKLPAMDELAKDLDVSTNTIRKALQSLSKQGVVQFSRGRYGGTFVVDIPEVQEQQTFRWLAVSSEYLESCKNAGNNGV